MEQKYTTITALVTLYSRPEDIEENLKQGFKLTGKTALNGYTHEMTKTELIKQPVFYSVVRYNHLSPHYVEAEPIFSGTWKQCQKYHDVHNTGYLGITDLLTDSVNAQYTQDYSNN